jgi:cytochrome c oxidase assembly factor CtaG
MKHLEASAPLGVLSATVHEQLLGAPQMTFAWAHPEAHLEPNVLHDPSWLSRWTADPLVLVTLLLFGYLYVRGTRQLWQRGGRYHGVNVWQLASMAAGWLSVIVSLLSPLDALSDVSFAAHMTQHEVLMLVAAPLLVLGRPLVAMLWALPAAARRRVGRIVTSRAFARGWRVLSGPIVTLLLHALAVWIWHIPLLFDAALEHEPIHAVQHLCFFITAALFWWALVHGRYGRAGYGVSVLFVFATALHQSVLGALLTVGRVVWYPLAAQRASGAGLDPLEDQQLAGLLMWVPSGVLFALLGLALFSAWLGHMERNSRRRDTRAADPRQPIGAPSPSREGSRS